MQICPPLEKFKGSMNGCFFKIKIWWSLGNIEFNLVISFSSSRPYSNRNFFHVGIFWLQMFLIPSNFWLLAGQLWKNLLMISYDQQEKMDKQPKWIWNFKATYEFIQKKFNKTTSFMTYERIKPSFKTTHCNTSGLQHKVNYLIQ
jgi:hypothetical protein